MKTSKKIFIAFIALIVSVVALFSIRVEKKMDDFQNDAEGLVTHVDSITQFKYLMVSAECQINVKSNANALPYFSIEVQGDSVPHFPTYRYSGDTLIIEATPQNARGLAVLYCSSPQSFVVNGALHLHNDQKMINAVVNQGQIYLYGDAHEELNVLGVDAKIQHRGNGLKILEAQLVHSQLNINKSHLETAHITAKDKSEIVMKRPLKLLLERDLSCRYREND